MHTLLLIEEKWVNPFHPITDEEHERMLDEAENSPILTAEEAEEYSKELIEKWSHKN